MSAKIARRSFLASLAGRQRPLYVFVTLLLALCIFGSFLISTVNSAAVRTASRVYGQATFSTGSYNRETIGADGLSFAYEIATDNSGSLYIADTDNNRVLFYQAGSTTASKVWGQPGFTGNPPGTSNVTLSGPQSVSVNRTNGDLFIADTYNNRVLYYPTGQFTATRVYGQVNFSGNGTGLSSTKLDNPLSVAADSSGGLYVVDNDNNRVLFYPSGQVTATRVYGQPNFTSGGANNGGRSATSLSDPQGVTVDSNNNVYIADTGNNRVLFYPSGQVTATVVYGQPNFTSGAPNRSDFPDKDSLYEPRAVAVDNDGGIYVTDAYNNRTLYFANDGNGDADRVFGQPDFVTDTPGNPPTASNMEVPEGVAVSGGTVYISDYSNNRVLFFANDGDEIADRVYGQLGSFTTRGSNLQRIAPNTLNNPLGMALDPLNGGLYAVDSENRRVLFYPSGSVTATNVWGQPDLTTGASTQTASSTVLGLPVDVVADSLGGLYVSDKAFNRVLYFANDGDNTADRVYGQDNFDTKASAAGNKGLNKPTGLALDGSGNLYVADQGNNRVLRFDTTGSNQDNIADAVWGQPDFATTTPGTGATGLNSPFDALFDTGGNLYISDSGNHRVLYYPTAQPTATKVYGQTDFAGSASGLSATKFNNPQSLTLDGSKGFYVADTNNNRVLYFANDNNTTADKVYGQTNFTSGGANVGGTPNATNLRLPNGLLTDSQGSLYIADSGNHRILFFGTGSTILTIASSSNPSSSGQAFIVTAVVTSPGGIPAGTVSLFIDGTQSGAAKTLNANAETSFTVPGTLTPGSHVITATYSGNFDFDPALSNTINQQVNPCNDLTVTSAQDSGTSGICGTLSNAISVANSAAASSDPVTITLSSGISIQALAQIPVINNANGRRIVLDGGCTLDRTPNSTIRTTNVAGDGLRIGANVTVIGLRINGFGGAGIRVQGAGNVLLCNWLNLDANGNLTAASRNAQGGIRFDAAGRIKFGPSNRIAQ